MNYRLRWKYINRPNDTAWKEYVGGDQKSLNSIFQMFANEVKSFSYNATFDFDVVMKREINEEI